MDFKKILFCFGLLSLVACDKSPSLDENIIGNRLENISSYSDANNSNTVSFYDKNTSTAHQFDLNSLQKIQSFPLEDSKNDHYIIASQNSGYTVDLSLKSLSILKTDGSIIKNPITLFGKPVSAAYSKESGILIIYDELSSVGILKLSNQGDVLSSWVGGPLVDETNSIDSGDLTPEGKLVLSLSNNTLLVVDINQSLINKSWTYESQNLSHQNILWIAAVDNNHVLYQSSTHLALYNISTQSLVSSSALSERDVRSYSRSLSPHVIAKGEGLDNHTIYYVDSLQIKTKSLNQRDPNLLYEQSTLDLARDKLTLIVSDRSYSLGSSYTSSGSYYYKKESIKQSRTYRFSDLLALGQLDLPVEAQVKQSSNYIFALYPSELGYAKRLDPISEEVKEMKFFNLDFIEK